MADALAGFLFIVSVLAMVFGAVIVLRYLQYKETVALAERGLVAPEQPSDGRGTLRWGIVITALGLALTCGMRPLGWSVARGSFFLGLGPWMLFGLLPLALGLALIAIYVVTSNGDDDIVEEGVADAGPPGDDVWTSGVAEDDGATARATTEIDDGTPIARTQDEDGSPSGDREAEEPRAEAQP